MTNPKKCPTCGHPIPDIEGPAWKVKLEEIRISQGLSRAQLAAKADLSRQGYALIMQEDRGVKVSTLERIVAVLGVSMASLFTEGEVSE